MTGNPAHNPAPPASRHRFSITIPTYNRYEQLVKTLEGLRLQDVPMQDFEVILIDDGSTDETQNINPASYPFHLKILTKGKIGRIAARNWGVEQSNGSILVFLDDDIFLTPGSLKALVELCEDNERSVVMGILIVPEDLKRRSQFARKYKTGFTVSDADREVTFLHITGGLCAMHRDQFFAAGMFQAVGNFVDWEDVILGFRAHQLGCRFFQSARSFGEHWDYSLENVFASCKRHARRSKNAVRVLQVYPDLKPYLSTFLYSYPINWRDDPARVIIRKCGRILFALRPMLWMLENCVRVAELYFPSGVVLDKLYRMVTAVYIYRGFQDGMREYGRITYNRT